MWMTLWWRVDWITEKSTVRAQVLIWVSKLMSWFSEMLIFLKLVCWYTQFQLLLMGFFFPSLHNWKYSYLLISSLPCKCVWLNSARVGIYNIDLKKWVQKSREGNQQGRKERHIVRAIPVLWVNLNAGYILNPCHSRYIAESSGAQACITQVSSPPFNLTFNKVAVFYL